MARMNYIIINQENQEDFQSVLPEDFTTGKMRVTLGAYDEEGYVCGAVSFRLAGWQYHLDWLFVEPASRRRGIASGLLDEIYAFIRSLTPYPLLAHFEASEEEDALHGFFLSLGKRPLLCSMAYSHERYYISHDALASSPVLLKQIGAGGGQKYFFEEPERSRRKILSKIEEHYVVEDLEAWEASCVPELCRVSYAKEGGDIACLIFVQRQMDEKLELSFLYSQNPRRLMGLLSDVSAEALKLFPKAQLVFDAINEGSRQLAEKIFPGAASVHIYEAEII